ncbi:MAG TPA: hypothetical protein VJL89_06490 [Thermodesulfovibrionia bacterium]|nr:hypothetical protein [Thermodesulfovibrionia bacterium]
MSHILNVLKKLESEKKRHDKSIDLKDTLLHEEFISDLKQKRHKFSPTFAAVTASLITGLVLTLIISGYFFYTSRNPAIPLKEANVKHPQPAKTEQQAARQVKAKNEVKPIDTGQPGVTKAELIESEQKNAGVTLASVQAQADKEKPKTRQSPSALPPPVATASKQEKPKTRQSPSASPPPVATASKQEKPKIRQTPSASPPPVASASKQEKATQQSASLKKENSAANQTKQEDLKQDAQEIQKPVTMKWKWEPLNKESATGSDNLSPKKEDSKPQKTEQSSLPPLSSDSKPDKSLPVKPEQSAGSLPTPSSDTRLSASSSQEEDSGNDKDGVTDNDSPKETLISNWQGGLPGKGTSEHNQEVASEKAKDADDTKLTGDSEPVPSLRIRGAIFISEGSRANYVVFDYNGQSHKLKEGESADDLTLVKIYSNKAMFRFKNKAFYRHF